MPSQQNIDQLQVLTDKFASAQAVIWANYSGLSVAAQTKLRRTLTEAGGEFLVAKNNLIRLALEKQMGDKVTPEIQATLEGPTAVMFCQTDAVAPLKVLVDFAKENELPAIKLGYMDGRILSTTQITDLSKLPSRNELIAKLIGQLQAPIAGLVNVASGNLRGLVTALKAIKDKKSE